MISKLENERDFSDVEEVRRWWEGDPAATHRFLDYDVPIAQILKTGAGPQMFEHIATGHRLALEKWIGIDPRHDLFEIGCGIGRDAMWLSQFLTNGTYVGIDIIEPSISWCRKNIAAPHPNFSFHHLDVSDHLHNPDGVDQAENIVFPKPDGTVDRVFAFSVFTHMFATQIQRYLAECARILRPGGRGLFTIFLYDEKVLASAQNHSKTAFDLKFRTEIEPGCRINNKDEPLGAIAYSLDHIEPLIAASGLKMMRPPLHGAWSGYYSEPDDGQDVLLLEKEHTLRLQ